MATVVWTSAAEQDLEEIFLYIGREQHSPAAAAQVIRDIAEKASSYADQPLLAESRPEFGESIRACHAHRYVVFYRPAPEGIEVLRVIHGSRDVFKVFRQGEPSD
jgi:toxin ParE1/3/4